MKNHLQFIINAVQIEMELDLLRNTRKQEYILARKLYYYLARKFTKYSLHKIGDQVNRDHASVLHNLKTFDRDYITYQVDKNYTASFRIIEAMCYDYFKEHDKERQYVNLYTSLYEENKELKQELADLRHVLSQTKVFPNDKENSLLETFRQLDEVGKDDVLFKSSIILKVRTKLSA